MSKSILQQVEEVAAQKQQLQSLASRSFGTQTSTAARQQAVGASTQESREADVKTGIVTELKQLQAARGACTDQAVVATLTTCINKLQKQLDESQPLQQCMDIAKKKPADTRVRAAISEAHLQQAQQRHLTIQLELQDAMRHFQDRQHALHAAQTCPASHHRHHTQVRSYSPIERTNHTLMHVAGTMIRLHSTAQGTGARVEVDTSLMNALVSQLHSIVPQSGQANHVQGGYDPEYAASEASEQYEHHGDPHDDDMYYPEELTFRTPEPPTPSPPDRKETARDVRPPHPRGQGYGVVACNETPAQLVPITRRTNSKTARRAAAYPYQLAHLDRAPAQVPEHSGNQQSVHVFSGCVHPRGRDLTSLTLHDMQGETSAHGLFSGKHCIRDHRCCGHQGNAAERIAADTDTIFERGDNRSRRPMQPWSGQRNPRDSEGFDMAAHVDRSCCGHDWTCRLGWAVLPRRGNALRGMGICAALQLMMTSATMCTHLVANFDVFQCMSRGNRPRHVIVPLGIIRRAMQTQVGKPASIPRLDVLIPASVDALPRSSCSAVSSHRDSSSVLVGKHQHGLVVTSFSASCTS